MKLLLQLLLLPLAMSKNFLGSANDVKETPTSSPHLKKALLVTQLIIQKTRRMSASLAPECNEVKESVEYKVSTMDMLTSFPGDMTPAS
jgi:hypothetical protein